MSLATKENGSVHNRGVDGPQKKCQTTLCVKSTKNLLIVLNLHVIVTPMLLEKFNLKFPGLQGIRIPKQMARIQPPTTMFKKK